MKKRTQKIIFTILFIVLIMFSLTSNTIYAAINNDYGKSSSTVVDNNLDKKVNDNPVTGALASFVYSIASLVEKLVGNVFTSISGDSEFPWADRIIFNAVPLLDINFFNPADNSFFLRGNEDTPVAKMIRNTYFTILAITIAFLTIVVGIAAIRMALTTLATEKAKYKEAITKWMFSIILIFLMHNIMSFIFFLNEGLVEVASGILSNKLDDYDLNAINNNLRGELSDEERVKNFTEMNDFEMFGDEKEEAKEYLLDPDNVEMASHLLQNASFREVALKYATEGGSFKETAFGNAIAYLFKEGSAFGLLGGRKALPEEVRDALPICETTIELAKNKEALDMAKENWDDYKGLSNEEKRLKYEEDANLSTLTKWLTTEAQIVDIVDLMVSITDAADDLRGSFHEVELEGGGTKWVKNSTLSDKRDIIKVMAQIFKEAAYTYPTDDEGVITGWSPSKISVTGALLYAIFVFQSILYLFSYIKRFFYIVILAIFAPIIVLFDFLGKALS